VLTADDLQEWVSEEKSAVSAYLGHALRPDPEVQQVLTALADRYLLALVSSSALTRLDACLHATGLSHLFAPERRFSAEDSLPQPTSKPDPAVYRHAGQRLGLSPDQAIAIEDSVPGAQAAVAAGFATIGNLRFVATDERAEREKQLREAGVVDVVFSWRQAADLLLSQP
jgi:beta-phosphoglucomutase-like phosphatase (HAD superfamily)